MNQTWKVAVVVVLIVTIIGVISVKRNQSDGQNEGTGIPVSISESAPGEMPSEYKVENLTGKGIPVLIDVGADACIPCKLMAPILEELKEELQGKIAVYILNLTQYPGLVNEYNISIKPTQIFYDASGQERFRHEGFLAKEDILSKWKEIGINLEDENADLN